MLKIYDSNNPGNVIPLPLDDDKRYVKHVYGGYDVLNFEMDSDNSLYRYIAEEVKVEDENNRYVVKNIDEHSDFVTVSCDIDLDDWKDKLFRSFRMTRSTLQEVLEVIVPDGWTITGASRFTKRATVEESEGEPFFATTAIVILDKAADIYGCVYKFDSINRVIDAIDPSLMEPSGQFFTDELNLESVGFVGNSTDFATRLYAYGKKDDDGIPVTFADINDGKEYVEDFTYSDKIIVASWSDERYTVKENLLAEAKARLSKLARPTRSYSCEAKDVGDGVWMYKVVTLIDRRHGTRVNHMIVEYDEYPNHVADKITLSTLEEKIESVIDRVRNELKGDIAKKQSTLESDIKGAVDRATSLITGNKGGHFKWLFDGDGKPIELLNLCDSDDVNTAQKLWRWNASGLGYSKNGMQGPFPLALTADGEINASYITAGVLTANLIKAGKLRYVDSASSIESYFDLTDGKIVTRFGNLMSIMDTGKFYMSYNGVEVGGFGTGYSSSGLHDVNPRLYYNGNNSDGLEIAELDNNVGLAKFSSDVFEVYTSCNFQHGISTTGISCSSINSTGSITSGSSVVSNDFRGDTYYLRNNGDWKGTIYGTSDTSPSIGLNTRSGDGAIYFNIKNSTHARIDKNGLWTSGLSIGGGLGIHQINFKNTSGDLVSYIYGTDDTYPSVSLRTTSQEGAIYLTIKDTCRCKVDKNGVHASGNVYANGLTINDASAIESISDMTYPRLLAHSWWIDGKSGSYIAGKTSSQGINVGDPSAIDMYIDGSKRLGVSSTGINSPRLDLMNGATKLGHVSKASGNNGIEIRLENQNDYIWFTIGSYAVARFSAKGLERPSNGGWKLLSGW